MPPETSRATEPRRALCLLALLCLTLGAGSTPFLDTHSFAGESATRWRLPRRLGEISGLAASGERLFAHDDERGIIYEIDHRKGRFLKAFALGDATVRDDFEGIEIVNGRFYLAASSGRLYESPEGRDGERVLYNTYATGIGPDCDVEGLAFEPLDGALLLLCKNPSPQGFVAIHRWSPERRSRVRGSPILVSVSTLAEEIGADSFHPSGIERHAGTGHYLLLAAREGALAEITASGDVLSVRELPRRHRQPEGIALITGGVLALADESARGRAHLTLYRPSVKR
jgi:uncharacterized protein YjiK